MTQSNNFNSEIIFYQTEDGQTKLDVRLEDETVWLTQQQQLATLLQTSKQNIGQHLKNIFAEGELDEISVVKNFYNYLFRTWNIIMDNTYVFQHQQ